jgi:LPXTG-motif cell wall-anchored protein
MKATLYVVLLSMMATAAVACPGFSVGQTSCSSGVLTKSSLSATCSSDNTIYVTGTVTAGSDFDGGSKVTLLPCVRGTGGNVCFDKYQQDAGSICELISAADGSGDCGSAGTYNVDLGFEIPEEARKLSSMFSMFEIKVLIDEEEACQQQADSTNNAAFLMVGVGSIVGASALYFIRRRKKPLLVLDDEEVNFDGAPQAQFVEMKGYDVGRMA